MATASDNLVVAAIDVGTTFSGYAFSLYHEFQRDPMKICTNHWPSHGELKIPTALLLDKEKKFDSFGYEAEEKYYQLVDNDEQEEWYFFKQFKMMLHKEGLKKTTELKDVSGKKSLPAVDVFRHTIEFLKTDLLKALTRSNPILTESDVKWVITLPAIWNDAAKQFMRIAANKAGIQDNKMALALEPEAAAIYCKMIPTQRMASTCGKNILASFQAGYRYLIADLGGGTADITAHEVESDFNLKEIHYNDGGDWGGVQVDKKFIEFLNEMFGDQTISEWTNESEADFLDLTREFENKKKKIGEPKTEKIDLTIPVTLIEIIKGKKLSLQDIIGKSKYKNKISAKSNKLRIDRVIVEGFFQETVNNIGNHIQKVLSNKNCANIQMILMVGGFSESAFVQQVMHRRFPNIRIVVPQEAGMSVLKGAVLFGHNPNIVRERICRRTYGIVLHYPYIAEEHLEEKHVEIDGKHLCKDIFEKFITVGDSIRLGEKKFHEFHNTFMSQERKGITEYLKVYASTEKSPKYVTDETCKLIGTIEIKPPSSGCWPDSVEGQIEMQFGGTEFEVRVIDDETHKEYSSSFDFLG